MVKEINRGASKDKGNFHTKTMCQQLRGRKRREEKPAYDFGQQLKE